LRANPAHDERGLPAKEAASKDLLAGDLSESILSQVRRRKRFARRLPPLLDGRRDPWLSIRPENGRAVA
jgi:hypothetical protein